MPPGGPCAPATPADLAARRWLLIRDLTSFSVKLLLEAVRDVVLIPLAVAAGGVGLLLGGERPERYFEEVLEVGRRFEAWLNLFGRGEGEVRSIDTHLERVETVLRDQYARGGVTAQAKNAIDRALDAIQRAAPRAGRPPGDPPRA
jgi:hypothetical protein